MATSQVTASLRNLSTFERFQTSTLRFPSVGHVRIATLRQNSFPSLVVKAATVVAPKVFILVAMLLFVDIDISFVVFRVLVFALGFFCSMPRVSDFISRFSTPLLALWVTEYL